MRYLAESKPMKNKDISDILFKPETLEKVIVIILGWCLFGQLTHLDAYPFPFLSTDTNLIGFVLMILLGIGQKKQEARDKAHQEWHEKHEDDMFKKLQSLIVEKKIT